MAQRRIDASFLYRRDTAANWEKKNPILLDGERIAVYTNAGAVRYKIGDGVKTYKQLPFDDEPLYNALAEIEQNGGSASAVNFTLLASDWANGQQTVSIAEVKADQHGVAGLPQVFTDAQYEATVAAAMYVSAQGNGTVTISCKGDVPQIDIPAVIILFS